MALDVDRTLAGYRNIAPELLIQLIGAGKAEGYKRARKIHDTLPPVTKTVCQPPRVARGGHRHPEASSGGTRRPKHTTVRSPLLSLERG